MIKRILLITSGQPALNPRLVKEADTLAGAGYNVTVLYAYWNNWGLEFDKQLIAKKKWKAVKIGGDPQSNKLSFFFSKVIFKIARIANKHIGDFFMADEAIARASWFLKREAKKYKSDLYIAHNLGALPAAVKAAKRYKKPCGFDAEDFHRHEISNDPENYDVILKKRIEEKYFPLLNYFTTSSQQIAKQYQALFPSLKPIVLLNVFSLSNLHANNLRARLPIKLIWFSQTIGENRGLEDIVDALKLLNTSDVELNLLGFISKHPNRFKQYLTENLPELIIHDPIPPDEIIPFIAQFDIGLALEPAFSINNDLALSNKVFTYIQAGLAVIASDTKAQSELMRLYPQCGQLYKKGDVPSLLSCITSFIENPRRLADTRHYNFELGQSTLNWEVESQKFLNLVQQTLS